MVPSRPGNSGGGKDATPTTRSERASPGHSAGTAVNPRLDRITERARRRPIERYNNLFHHLDVELMTVAFDANACMKALVEAHDGVALGESDSWPECGGTRGGE
jgi:hypothetical protein